MSKDLKIQYMVKYRGNIIKSTYSIIEIESGDLNIDGISLKDAQIYGLILARRQSTGFTDIFGNEVYEGDIIKNKLNETFTVYFDKCTPFLHPTHFKTH